MPVDENSTQPDINRNDENQENHDKEPVNIIQDTRGAALALKQNPDHLTASETRKLKSFFNKYFEELYETGHELIPTNGDPFNCMGVTTEIAKLAGEESSYCREGRIPPRYRQALTVFSKEASIFLREKNRLNEPEKIGRFRDFLVPLFQSYYPSILDEMHAEGEYFFRGKADASDTRKKIAELRKKNGEISPEETSHLINFYRKYFDEIYEGNDFIPSSKNPLQNKKTVIYIIASLVGEEEIYLSRRKSSPRYRKAIEIFLKELILFTREKSHNRDKESLKKTERLSQYLYKELFSHSPNIVNEINTSDLFRVAVMAAQAPETQEGAGESIIAELGYNLSFCNQRTYENIIKNCSNLSTPEALGVLHICQVAGVRSGYNEGYGEQGARTAFMIADYIKRSYAIPFIDYSADLCLKKIDRGELNDNLTENQYNESAKLKQGIQSDYIENDDTLLRISNDYIGILNNNRFPKYLGKLNGGGEEAASVQFKPYFSIAGDSQLNPFPTEDSDEMALLLQQLHRPGMRALIEQDLDIDFNEMTLASQIHLLRFMQDKDIESFARLKQALTEHPDIKSEILTSFLACAEDRENGEVILGVAGTPNLSEEQRQTVFREYALVAEKIEDMTEAVYKAYLETTQKTHRTTEISKEKIRGGILGYGSALLRGINDTLEDSADILNDSEFQELMARIHRFDAQTQAMLNVVKNLSIDELSAAEIAKIPGLSMETVDQAGIKARLLDIDSKTGGQLERTITENFTKGDYGSFVHDFSEDTTAKMHILTAQDELLYTCGTRSWEHEGKEIEYIDWIAVNPEVKGEHYRMTEAFLKEQLALHKDGDNNFEALSEPHVLTAPLFVEKFGFVGKGTSDVPEHGMYEKGDYILLRKHQEDQGSYRSKQMKDGELIHLADQGGRKADRLQFETLKVPEEDARFLELMNQECENGRVLTRMIQKGKDGKGNKEYLCVFEQESSQAFAIAA